MNNNDPYPGSVVEKIQTMSVPQLLRSLSRYRSDSSDRETEQEKEDAQDVLYEKMISDSFVVHRLFDAVRYDSPDSVRDLHSILSLYRRARQEFISLSHTQGLDDGEISRGNALAEILNRFVEVGRGLYDGSFDNATNYLFPLATPQVGHSEYSNNNPSDF